MSLTLSHCAPTDAPAFASAFVSTYERMPRHQASYGRIPRSRQLALFTKAFNDSISLSPTPPQERHFLKVTDCATNELVAFAIWDWLPDGYKDEDPFAIVGGVPEGADERCIRDFGKLTGEARGSGERGVVGHWLLSLLGTHPSHERRGAAAMLIQWPFSRADEEGKRCYVDASSVGYKLYKRLGFTDVAELSVDLDEYEGGKGLGVQRWVGMVREPGGR